MTLPARRRRRIVAVGAAFLLLIAAELLARALVPAAHHAPVRLQRVLGADDAGGSHQGWAAALDAMLRPDPILQWRLRSQLDLVATGARTAAPRPWRVITSADGFRADPIGWLDPTGPLLVVLGSSAAFGWGVDLEDTAAARLPELLPAGWQVRNLAVPGYSAAQGRLQLRGLRGLPSPKALVLAFGEADARPVFSDDPAWSARQVGPGSAFVKSALDLRLSQLLAPPTATLLRPLLGATHAVGRTRPRLPLSRFSAALLELSNRAATTILLDVCAPKAYGEAMAELAETHDQIQLLRFDEIHGETLDGCLPTAQGHAAIAGAVAAQLGAEARVSADPHQDGRPPGLP